MNKKIAAILAGIMAAVMVLSLLLGLLATVANAATSGEIQDQIDQLKGEQASLEAQIRDLEKDLAKNNNELKNMVSRKNGIDQQITLMNSQVALINQTISAQNLLIADAQEELEMAQEKLEILQQAYAARIRVMEEQGEISYWTVIFKATSFVDLLSRMTMVVEIARADQVQLEQLRNLVQQVQDAKQLLEDAKQDLEQSKLDLQKTQEELYVKQTEAEGLLVALIVKSGQYKLELNESEDLQHALMEEIAHKEELYDEALYAEWLATSVPPTTTTVPTTAPTTAPTNSSTQGKFVTRTVDGITWITPTTDYWISSEFGYRIHPITKEWALHKGIDMAAPCGTPIYATRAGKVTVASFQDGGAGWYVAINHGDGYSSIYMHMTHYIVKAGQRVEAGQIIGYVGTSGGSTGYHLHFGIAYNGTYVDPQKYIKT